MIKNQPQKGRAKRAVAVDFAAKMQAIGTGLRVPVNRIRWSSPVQYLVLPVVLLL